MDIGYPVELDSVGRILPQSNKTYVKNMNEYVLRNVRKQPPLLWESNMYVRQFIITVSADMLGKKQEVGISLHPAPC